MRPFLLVLTCLFVSFIGGCGSQLDTITDVVDSLQSVPRKDIDKSRLGVNAFFNDARFGTNAEQANEIKNALGIRYVRILLDWNNDIQPSPNAEPNFAFYDGIIAAIPPGVDALAVLTNVPSWVSDPANWVGGSARSTFVERWVRPVVRRYGRSPALVGFQIWNEPNMVGRIDNEILSLPASPDNFLDLMARAHTVCKDIAPSKTVVNGATTAINQNFPETLEYNRDLRDGGIENFTDVYAIHYYSRQFENVVRPNGIRDFLNSVPKRVWVTESGAQGTNEQLKFIEQVFPYLDDKIGKIDRFYYYQMYEGTDAASTYGLRNLTPGSTVSDLYVSLRDGKR